MDGRNVEPDHRGVAMPCFPERCAAGCEAVRSGLRGSRNVCSAMKGQPRHGGNGWRIMSMSTTSAAACCPSSAITSGSQSFPAPRVVGVGCRSGSLSLPRATPRSTQRGIRDPRCPPIPAAHRCRRARLGEPRRFPAQSQHDQGPGRAPVHTRAAGTAARSHRAVARTPDWKIDQRSSAAAVSAHAPRRRDFEPAVLMSQPPGQALTNTASAAIAPANRAF